MTIIFGDSSSWTGLTRRVVSSLENYGEGEKKEKNEVIKGEAPLCSWSQAPSAYTKSPDRIKKLFWFCLLWFGSLNTA